MGSMGDLAGFGFWMFIAAVVVGGMWFDARKREAQQETLRRLVEGGKHVDEAVLEKMLALGNKAEKNDQDLITAGIIVLFVGGGLYVFGWLMQGLSEKLLTVMTGVAGMMAFISMGLLAAGLVAKSRHDKS